MIVVVFIVILLVIVLIVCNIKQGYTKQQRYNDDPNNYHYNEENPNAVVSGTQVSGTVYAKNLNDIPSLGWIT